ncbi:ABC transporter transmembrane domain-containing protein [Alkalicoccobacillus porphyridii]|uniref:ATP-binding cassette domain-containing protein n=1 Tax=Alkalicoccobacillus porphyridii TaxID=2597270 RepID=A0A553ZUJ3_9BACI|nr:ABC transporter transmembrane domain-containing protein [Alkalicoccobacillus porphyridii]TSB45168.1 ATP-binding cassette domain-containing protein [Alkalicoccobacillus porphyridii]
MRVYRDLWWFFKQEKKAYIVGILVLILVSLLVLVPPYVIGRVVDQIYDGTLTTESLFGWILLLMAVGIITYGLRYVWRIMIFGASIRLARTLRNQLYEHFTRMSSPFYQRYRTGDLMAHGTNDIRAVQMTAGQGVLTIVDSITMGGFVVLTMAIVIDWKLTLITLTPMPFMAILTNIYGGMLHKRFHAAQGAFSELNDNVQGVISGVRVTKAFGQEKADTEKFRLKSLEVVGKNMRVAKVDALFSPTISFIVGVCYFLAVAFGARYVVSGDLTIGELTSFTVYLGLLIWPMLAFGMFFNTIERGRASYDRIQKLLSEKQDIVEVEEAIDEPISGDIHVSIPMFQYPGTSSVVLQQIDLTIKEGKTLGIVGKTGSGKSSLLRLLLREYELTDGTIIFGHRPIEQLTLNRLKQTFGVVPQDHFLFSTTIADNVAFAKPNASMEQVIHACQLAGIHQDIIQFNDSYDTVVGERGVTLSGGQKQRLSIARALLADPEILILDDSLSAVDAATEEYILGKLKEHRRGQTNIITAHRLSAIHHAECIIVLENGEIIEQGNHNDLMSLDGWYSRMYNQQQLEHLVEKGGRDA